MKTPYQRNGKRPIKKEYLKLFGFYGEMLWHVDMSLYERDKMANEQAKNNREIISRNQYSAKPSK